MSRKRIRKWAKRALRYEEKKMKGDLRGAVEYRKRFTNLAMFDSMVRRAKKALLTAIVRKNSSGDVRRGAPARDVTAL